MPQELPIFIQDYLSYIETIKNKSPHTVLNYRSDINQFLSYVCEFILEDKNKSLKSILIDELQSLTLVNFYEYFIYIKKTNALSNSSLARKIACIKSLFTFLTKKAKLITNNITNDLEYPKIPKQLPKHLSLEESIKLLSVISGKYELRDYAIITLFLNCGLRLSELVNIRIPNIKNDVMVIIGKGNKQRNIPLNDSCISAINNYLQIRNKIKVKTDILFLTKDKNIMSHDAVQLLFKKYLKLAQLDNKYGVHVMRHTAATLMHSHGVDILQLKNILGHESISTTEIYTHINNDKIRDAMIRNPLSKIKKN